MQKMMIVLILIVAINCCDTSGSADSLIIGSWNHLSDTTIEDDGMQYVNFPFEWGVESEILDFSEDGSFNQSIDYGDTLIVHIGEWEISRLELTLNYNGGSTRSYEIEFQTTSMTLTQEISTSTVVSKYSKID